MAAAAAAAVGWQVNGFLHVDRLRRIDLRHHLSGRLSVQRGFSADHALKRSAVAAALNCGRITQRCHGNSFWETP